MVHVTVAVVGLVACAASAVIAGAVVSAGWPACVTVVVALPTATVAVRDVVPGFVVPVTVRVAGPVPDVGVTVSQESDAVAVHAHALPVVRVTAVDAALAVRLAVVGDRSMLHPPADG